MTDEERGLRDLGKPIQEPTACGGELASSQESWSFLEPQFGFLVKCRLSLAYPWYAGIRMYPKQKEEVGICEEDRKEGKLPHSGGLGQSFPATQRGRVSPTPITFPASVREGQGGEAEQGEERERPGLQKLRLGKQVQEDASGQAADPGSPKGPRRRPYACTDTSSTLEGRAVLL